MPIYEYDLKNIRTNYTVEVVYRRIKYLATSMVLPGDDGAKHGTISPEVFRTPVDCGSDMKFTIKPDRCFRVLDVKVTIAGGDPV